MPFIDTSWDDKRRTFKGHIDWSDNPIWSDHKWEYTMVFSEDLKTIEAGSIFYKDQQGRKNSSGNLYQKPSYIFLGKE